MKRDGLTYELGVGAATVVAGRLEELEIVRLLVEHIEGDGRVRRVRKDERAMVGRNKSCTGGRCKEM
jgi:hypothetical protein